MIFIDWYAPAYKAGGPIQSIVNLVNTNMKGVEYRIVCSNRDLDGQLLAVEPDKWVCYNTNTQVWYNSKSRNILGVLREVEKWKPDIFFINGIYSLYYNLLPILFGKAGKKIISARGMLHDGALSQKSLKKKIYLKAWKLLRIHRKNSFHATNEDEKRFILSAFGTQTQVHVAPNLPRILKNIDNPGKEPNKLQLISIGLISPMKNYLQVIRALASCEAEITYTIYGPVKDPAYWQECRQSIGQLPQNIAVHYKGDIPSVKVPEVLQQAHVFVLPSKSENFGHAIYEALASGKPVITSHNTPWNGLAEANAGFNISPEKDYELSEAICFFARADETEMAKWSAGAKIYAEKSIDLNKIASQYLAMFQV